MNKIKFFLILIAIMLIVLLFKNIIKKEKKYSNYLALGDSIAEGYLLNNKNDRYSKLIQDNYKIKNENFTDLSKSGMTAQELASNLKNSEYINRIKNSDLITISIGSNELLGVFTNILQDVILSHPTTNLNQLYTALNQKLQSESSKKSFENGISLYEQSWEEILKQIKDINPNATIVATEFYNPYHNIGDLGVLGDNYIKQLNDILHDKSKNDTEYYIANIYEDFNNPDIQLTNVSTNTIKQNTGFNPSAFDPHPNISGHKLIADKIIEALSNR